MQNQNQTKNNIENSLFSAETEEAIIGGLILMAENNCATLKQTINTINGAKAFFKPLNREIFTVICELVNANKPFDAIILFNILKDKAIVNRKNAEYIAEYLSDLYSRTNSYANIEAYISILNDKLYLREFYALSNSFEGLIKDYHESPDIKATDLVLKVQEQLTNITNEHLSQHFAKKNNKEKMQTYLSVIEQRLENTKNGINGIATGVKILDDQLKGLRAGQLAVIAGYSSSGKSALALNIAANAAFKQDKKTLVFSLEMPDEDVIDRLIAANQKIPMPKLLDGSVMCDDTSAAKVCAFADTFTKNDNLQIADQFTTTLNDIKQAAYIEKHNNGDIDLIVIDYLQLIKIDAKNHGTRAEAIANLTREFKLLAKELNVPIILLSQLSKQEKGRINKRPTTNDLKESSSIEQDADIVLFVYREKQFNTQYAEDIKNHVAKDVAELIIAKHRQGETTTVYANYYGHFFIFDSIDDQTFTPSYPKQTNPNNQGQERRTLTPVNQTNQDTSFYQTY